MNFNLCARIGCSSEAKWSGKCPEHYWEEYSFGLQKRLIESENKLNAVLEELTYCPRCDSRGDENCHAKTGLDKNGHVPGCKLSYIIPL